MLLPHIDALASHAPPDTDTEATAYLLNQAGVFLDGQGQPGRAAGYLQRALAGSARVLGADHPDTLASRNNLAARLPGGGGPGPGHPAATSRPWPTGVRVLGADHPDTLASRNNLADAYESAGDLGRAIPLFEQALADRRAGAGRRPPRHPGARGTTSPTPMSRRGTWAGPSRCTSRPWPTACGCWAPTTPTP